MRHFLDTVYIKQQRKYGRFTKTNSYFYGNRERTLKQFNGFEWEFKTER